MYNFYRACTTGESEEKKKSKYLQLASNHIFTPVAIETSGVIGPQSLKFLHDLSRRLEQVTGEPKSRIYLMQRLSVAVQQGNAVSVLGSSGLTHSGVDEALF